MNLQKIHGLGVNHGDVCKPGNVIDFNGKPVIVDFGNASCDHVCGQTEAIPFDVIAPYDRLCYEIAEAAKETWLWRASRFSIFLEFNGVYIAYSSWQAFSRPNLALIFLSISWRMKR